jgi:hypothetical protein
MLKRSATEPSRLMAYDTTTAEVREIIRAPGNQAFNHDGDLQGTPDSRAIITTVATVMHAAGNEQEWRIPIDGRAPQD